VNVQAFSVSTAFAHLLSFVLSNGNNVRVQLETTGRTEIGNTVVPLPVFVSKTLFHIPLTSPSLPRPAALVSFVGWLASAETAGGLGRRVERGNQELGLGHGK
jgi:hypothetical protein